MNFTETQRRIEQLVQQQDWSGLREAFADLHPADIADIICQAPEDIDAVVFRLLPREKGAEVFSHLPRDHQEGLLHSLVGQPLQDLLNDLPPDDRNHFLSVLPAEVTKRLLDSLSAEELRDARNLLGYALDEVGHYMTPEYVALREHITAGEAIALLRQQGRGKETLNVLYVVDGNGRLIKDIDLGALVTAPPETVVDEIGEERPVSLNDRDDREEALRVFARYDRVALPVIDAEGRMLGIITHDDVLDVAEEEATEDIHKLGGVEALDMPYMSVRMRTMLRKRGSVLTILFFGGLLTATVMSSFEGILAQAVVLAVFIPLVVSCGGNTGSQAASLIIRALAVRDVRLRDWWRVLGREALTGLILGVWLGIFGFLRVAGWQWIGWEDFGQHYLRLALTVFTAITGIVTFGSLLGAMMPFALQRLGLDPATSSTPFVSTLVDVSGLLIYLLLAMLILGGTMI
ncbi:MAG: magnesium transporter [Candidatus Hydrogenedentes bacterium]|nr:magnesium transporter [Candidatus Hydrogenedentota bacterium]